jgi:hypothetical protein
MAERIRQSVVALVVAGTLGLVDQQADANVSSVPGFEFQVFVPPVVTTGQSWGALHNTSTMQTAYVVAPLPYPSNQPVYIGLKVTTATWCQATLVVGGGAAWQGPQTFGSNSTLTWQTLALGTPPVAAGTSLIVGCALEPNGYIGIAYQ